MKRGSVRGKRRGIFALGAWASLVGIVAASVVATADAGCAQQPTVAPVRSLERSGATSYVCLSVPGDPGGILRPLSACSNANLTDPSTFSLNDAGTLLVPHLYAMVTQTTRGEIAVVDLSATNNSVVDEDPGIPGANFLPVGAQPVAIVSTPGSTATFVDVAEIGAQGIYALPSANIRPSSLLDDAGIVVEPPRPVPQLSSWPACSLPSAPGAMLLISDPPFPNPNGAVRASCTSPYGEHIKPAGENGDLSLENAGRQKLVVAMPELGGIVVIDAQDVLDREPGSFETCKVERWLPLKVELPDTSVRQQKPGPACTWPIQVGPTYASNYKPQPSGMTYNAEPQGGGKLYIGDLHAPVIHVVQLPSPCEPIETAPLLPSSQDDFTRIVTTKKAAVGPETKDFKRYVYAIDEDDSSLMVFDVSDNSTTRQPLIRPHPEWDPLTSRDRVRFGSPIADILLVTHDAEQPNPQTGVASQGVSCDPNPSKSCDLSMTTKGCDTGALYRTDATFDIGAGPLLLRGEYAYAALTNGHIGIADIDDFDAPCRVPSLFSKYLFGCSSDSPAAQITACETNVLACEQSSQEESCNVVLRNTPRDASYTAANQYAGFHQAGVEILPLLYDLDGTVIDDPNASRMVATLPPEGAVPPGFPFSISVGGSPLAVCSPEIPSTCFDTTTGIYTDESGKENTLLMNLEDPRAQAANQAWTVTWEGGLPGFTEKLATLVLQGKPSDGLYENDARFCDSGILSTNAQREILQSEGVSDKKVCLNAKNDDGSTKTVICEHDADCKKQTGPCKEVSLIEAEADADYVQLFSEVPEESDAYWTIQTNGKCSFSKCNTAFGTTLTPEPGRDLRIVEAYQDHLELVNRSDGSPIDASFVECCFQPPLNYNVRVGNQWVALGSTSGFIHHVIPDPVTGLCRNNCDPVLERMNGRIRPAHPSDKLPILDFDASNPKATSAFINPMFRFAILPPCYDTPPPPGMPCSAAEARDDQFQFATQGAFEPLLVNLAPDSSTLMQPVSITEVPETGELNVTDGTNQGLTLVLIGSASVSRRFF